MEKFLVIVLIVFAILLYATTVHVQEVFDDSLLENTNIQI